MNATEFQSALQTHVTEQKMLAAAKRREATKTRAKAQAYAAQHVGGAMEPARQRILQDAEAAAQLAEAAAARASLRASRGEAGVVLHGRTEWSDIP